MKIDLSKIRIPYNWVLIKPDKNFDTYQLNGKETGIAVGYDAINMAAHFSISGTVVAAPEQLIFNGHILASLKNNKRFDATDVIKTVGELKRGSVAYNVPIEIKKGDKVYFDYSAHISANNEGRLIDTEEGQMLIVRYDLLILKECDNEAQMLNGFILVAPAEIETKKDIDGFEYVPTKSGLFLPVFEEERKLKRNGHTQEGIVVYAGTPCKGYLDFLDKGADMDEVGNVGQTVFYDSRHQKRFEVEYHRTVFGNQKLYRIHRKDIITVIG